MSRDMYGRMEWERSEWVDESRLIYPTPLWVAEQHHYKTWTLRKLSSVSTRMTVPFFAYCDRSAKHYILCFLFPDDMLENDDGDADDMRARQG